MPRCVGSPSAGVSAGKTSSFLFTPRCWSTCTTRRLSQLSAPAWKGHQRMGPQACCARGSENPLRALGRRDSGTEQGFRSAAGTPIRYLVPSGNAQRIASSPSYRSWPRHQHWTLSFPYQFSHRFWMHLLPVNSFPAASQVAQW